MPESQILQFPTVGRRVPSQPPLEGFQPVLNPVPDHFSAPHSTSQIPPVFTALKLSFNFGAAPIDAPPSVVLLALKNSGMVPLDWYGVGCWGTGWRCSLVGCSPGRLVSMKCAPDPAHRLDVDARVGLGSPNRTSDLAESRP